ncbi:hypothetical protein Tco_1455582 [Tanacetum coccineum]
MAIISSSVLGITISVLGLDTVALESHPMVQEYAVNSMCQEGMEQRRMLLDGCIDKWPAGIAYEVSSQTGSAIIYNKTKTELEI